MAFGYGWSDRFGTLEFDPNIALEELIDDLKVPYVGDYGGVDLCSVFTIELSTSGLAVGIAERLGLPQGLTFEEVFARI